MSGSCPGSFLVRVRLVSGFVSGSCRVRVWFVSGFVSGSCLVRVRFVVHVWFVFGSGVISSSYSLVLICF